MSKTVSLYVYKVKGPAAAEAARQQALEAFRENAGFVGWTRLRRPDGADENVFADVMEWDSAEALDQANKQFVEDARIAPFREQIAETITGDDYRPI